MSAPEAVVFQGGGRLLRGALGAAVVGVVALVVAAFVAPERLWFAYLAAYAYVVSVALGALVFLMVCHAMHAGWPTLLRRLTEAMVATLPVLAVLFLPLLAGLRTLYPWLRISTLADPEERALVALKAPYLNLGWFLARTALFFAVWIVVGEWLCRGSRRTDEMAPEAAAATKERLYALGGALLPLVALTLSFASFDWLMSLTPTWQSTMYPVYFFAGGFLGALALLTVLTSVADSAGRIRGITVSHYYALGRLLLAFTIFWAYIAFFQLLIIWIADKPDEVTFYLARIRGGWRVLSIVLVLAHFVIPFFALLGYDLKRRRAPLTAVAAWLLAAHYLDVHWLVLPASCSAGLAGAWIDLGALLAVAGLTVSYAVFRLRGVRLVPVHDPALPDALRYESS
jgi:hypothetical protein